MIKFILVFSLIKVIRSMIAATVFMTAACIVCSIGKNRTWRCNLGILCIVPLACFMSYSKIFYAKKIIMLIGMIHKIAVPRIAAVYFGFAGIFLVRYISIHWQLRRSLNDMQRLREADYPEYLLKSRGAAIRVYLTPDDRIGPFAGGIIHPYIVVPDILKSNLSREEFNAILYHEALHIRLGHILILNIFSVLKIIWWIHPLIYVCDRKLRENIEYSSDEGSVMLGFLKAYEYGGVMLKTLQIKNRVSFLREGITAFSADSYKILKRRMQSLGMIGQGKDDYLKYQKKKKNYHIRIAAVAVIGAAVMIATSYPRYTKINEITVFDEEYHPFINDLEAEGICAIASDKEFYISSQEFQKIACKYDLHGEYVIFSYGLIMKMPGIGGGGQAAMVSTKDPSDVFLLGRKEWVDELKIFALKYLM